MTAALAINGLAKSFGALRATDNLTFDVEANECHAVIGPNGAGKSTLIGQILGEITPDAGSIAFFGEDITRWRARRRAPPAAPPPPRARGRSRAPPRASTR